MRSNVCIRVNWQIVSHEWQVVSECSLPWICMYIEPSQINHMSHIWKLGVGRVGHIQNIFLLKTNYIFLVFLCVYFHQWNVPEGRFKTFPKALLILLIKEYEGKNRKLIKDFKMFTRLAPQLNHMSGRYKAR